ncbi:MAG: type II secretion system F family protein [Pikeienuella sp.]
MAAFTYRALDAAGARERGEIEAPDRAAAAGRLRARGLLPVAVEPQRPGGLMALLNTEITPRGALSRSDRVGFTRGLATLSGAGLPMERALEILAELGEAKRARAAAAKLLASVRGGASLGDAMDEQPAAFSAAFRSVVRAGETGATLAPALARLADEEEKAAKRRGALISALAYPAFLSFASVGAVAVLLIHVVPTFAPMLKTAGVAPPLSTRIVIGAGDIAARGWPLILAAVAGLILGAQAALMAPGLRLRWSRIRLSLPLAGDLRRKFATARAARLLGELLAGGVALPAALKLAGEAAGEPAFRAEIARAAPLVEAGRGLSAPLTEGGVFSPLALQLIRVGEESGQLAPMLLKSADILDEEASAALDRALGLLTPALTLAMGALIALIVSSIMFAMFSINELAIRRP